MKTIFTLLLALLTLTGAAQTINWNTNHPTAKLTVAAPDKLLVNGRPLETPFTNAVFTAMNLPAGSTATVTNLGVTAGVAYFQIGIPAGTPTNAMFSSATTTLLSTNFNFATSNALGSFTNVMSVRATGPAGGGGGLSPATNATTTVYYSTNGTSGWTANLAATPNVLYVSVISAAPGAGQVTISSAEHPELDNRVNDLTRQITRVRNPVTGLDAVNKQTMDTAIANAVASQMRTETNGDYYYGPNNQKVFVLRQAGVVWATNLAISISGTNWALTIQQTNLPTGWVVQLSPDIALLNGFVTITNWTGSTNTGVVTILVPQSSTPGMAGFFRIVSFNVGGASFYFPVELAGGELYTSNTWNWSAITNSLKDHAFWTGSSNGLDLVTVWQSNTSYFYLVQSNAVKLKIPAP